MTTAGSNGARINVWVYRNTINNNTDRIRFHINTTADLSGSPSQLLEIFPEPTIAPTVPSNGWYNYTADIPASFNTEPTVYIIAQGTTDGSGSSYGIGFDDFKVEAIPSCSPPTALTPSGVTSTGAQVDWTPPGSGTITDYGWELRTSGAAGSGASGLVSSGTTASTTVNFTTLNGGTAYTFHVRTNCINPDASAYTSITFVTTPANDECADAITLLTSTSLPGGTVGGTQTMAASSCAGFTGVADDDVWYKFTTHYAGNVSVALTGASSGFDAVIVVYSGACGSLTEVGCADATGGAGNETVSLTGLNASETYYFRVFGYGSGVASQGTYNLMITGNALPVTLAEFKGERMGTANKLSWVTSTESNNRGFDLERSVDGRTYSAIAHIASKAENGNSNTALNYQYNDEKPVAGSNYYRLKQIDKDGKFTYSGVVLLKSRITAVTLSSVYPNPARTELNMIIGSPAAEKVTIQVTDLTGKVVMQHSTQLAIGDNQVQLNVQSLAQGTYVIKAVCANGCETAVHRFVKH
jgi:hypothetical protein